MDCAIIRHTTSKTTQLHKGNGSIIARCDLFFCTISKSMTPHKRMEYLRKNIEDGDGIEDIS
jgi:hypothetical protein